MFRTPVLFASSGKKRIVIIVSPLEWDNSNRLDSETLAS